MSRYLKVKKELLYSLNSSRLTKKSPTEVTAPREFIHFSKLCKLAMGVGFWHKYSFQIRRKTAENTEWEVASRVSFISSKKDVYLK